MPENPPQGATQAKTEPTQVIGSDTQHEVVILGAGMSGLGMATKLQRAGMHDFVIIEKQPGLGGTWWDNTCPGAHVDVPSPVYSFSFAPNPHWSLSWPHRGGLGVEPVPQLVPCARRSGGGAVPRLYARVCGRRAHPEAG